MTEIIGVIFLAVLAICAMPFLLLLGMLIGVYIMATLPAYQQRKAERKRHENT